MKNLLLTTALVAMSSTAVFADSHAIATSDANGNATVVTTTGTSASVVFHGADHGPTGFVATTITADTTFVSNDLNVNGDANFESGLTKDGEDVATVSDVAGGDAHLQSQINALDTAVADLDSGVDAAYVDSQINTVLGCLLYTSPSPRDS